MPFGLTRTAFLTHLSLKYYSQVPVEAQCNLLMHNFAYRNDKNIFYALFLFPPTIQIIYYALYLLPLCSFSMSTFCLRSSNERREIIIPEWKNFFLSMLLHKATSIVWLFLLVCCGCKMMRQLALSHLWAWMDHFLLTDMLSVRSHTLNGFP